MAERAAAAKKSGSSGGGNGNGNGKTGRKVAAPQPQPKTPQSKAQQPKPAQPKPQSQPPKPQPKAEPVRQSGFAAAAPWISLVARLALGAMWLYYCVPKLGSASVNEASVRNFRILSGGLVNTFAYAQPYVELALGLLVIAGLGTRLVAALSGLLLLVYIGGIASLGARGIHITCGCGGAGGQVAVGQTRYTLDILRDVLYLVPAAWLLWKPKSPFSADAALLPELAVETAVPTPRSAPAKGGSRR